MTLIVRLQFERKVLIAGGSELACYFLLLLREEQNTVLQFNKLDLMRLPINGKGLSFCLHNGAPMFASFSAAPKPCFALRYLMRPRCSALSAPAARTNGTWAACASERARASLSSQAVIKGSRLVFKAEKPIFKRETRRLIKCIVWGHNVPRSGVKDGTAGRVASHCCLSIMTKLDQGQS